MSLVSMKRRAVGYRADDKVFEKLDLRSMHAPQSVWQGVVFRDCKLGLTNFASAVFNDVTFERCTAYGTAFPGTVMRGVRFINSDLEQSGFGGAILTGTSFTGCRMAYSTFAGATLHAGVAFSGTNLHGADFDVMESDFGSPAFEDCTLWGVKAPFGCGFWNGKFDQRSVDLFAGMLARACPEKTKKDLLMGIAGIQYDVVERLMREKDEHD